MADGERPPSWIHADVWLGPGVDTGGKRFWCPSSDPGKYPWDVRGRYEVRDGEIHVTEIAVRPNPEAPSPIDGLDTERIRRLTRLSPIKRAITEQEHADKQRITEAVEELDAAGRTVSRSLREWASELDQSWAKPVERSEPSQRHSDDDWARWALDYLSRVGDKGSAYGIQRDIAADGSWNVGYEAVRSRVKTLRRLGWITGEGHLVSPGPNLAAWSSTRRSPPAI